jgi:diguanylate cyclase (GGDEF)-like protein/PAS domain S-box-containing protein
MGTHQSIVENSSLKFSDQRKTGVFIALSLLVFIAAVTLAYKPATTVLSAVESYKHVSDRLTEVSQLRSLLVSLSSAERSFAATGDPEYRVAYSEAAPKIRHIVDALTALRSDDPGQKQRFERLGDLMGRRLALAEEAIGAREAVEPSKITEEDGLAREIGAQLSKTENEENARLRQMGAAVRESMLIILVLGGAGVSVSLLVIILALGFMKREDLRRRRAEEYSAKLLQTAEQAGDLITIINQNGTIEFMNKAAEKTTGYERNKLVGTRSKAWFPWYSDKQFLRAMRETVLSGRPFETAATGRKKTGELFFVNEVVTPLVDRDGKITRIISTARDITRQRQLEEKLDYLEKYDLLTGIPNRKYFVDMVEQEIVSAKERGCFLSVIIIDIDQSKHINDLFGSEAGDAVLKWISEKMRTAVSPRDIIARLGSDEFAVLHFDDSRPVVAGGVAENIRRALSQSFVAGEHEFAVTVSIGAALYPENGKDAHSLLTNAYLALDEAQALGRNSIQFFNDRIKTGVSETFYFEKRLFSALKNNEYLVHYQPYCDLVTQNVAGAEALIKWKNNDLGMISPARFIPSLESTGMIIDVGKWVLEAACSQIREWEMKKRTFPVSVNLSLVQFRHKYLVGMVADAVNDFKLDPRHLTLEVTESIFIHDMDFAIKTLKRLKDVGVSLSVDDFGTGYSSLSYLKKLPVDIIKIDMSFVRDVTRDQDAASIVTAITSLARSLNLKTIAEGVETEEQRNILHLLRCDMGQGYYFSMPIPAAEFDNFLAQTRKPFAK